MRPMNLHYVPHKVPGEADPLRSPIIIEVKDYGVDYSGARE